MVNWPHYPFAAYRESKPAAGVITALVGISLIAWIVQSKKIHFRPRRPQILILISHITMLIQLILRAAFSKRTNDSKGAFTALSVLLSISLRTVILANYDFLTQVHKLKTWITRTIIIGSVVLGITSAVLMAPAGSLSYDPDKVDTSFQLRQASSAIVLGMTVLFYPVWFLTKTIKHMTRYAFILLIISSFACLIVGVYLVIISVPEYYTKSNEKELWVYIFQIVPNVIALFAWSILHPRRSLKQTEPSKEPSKEEEETKTKIDDSVQIVRL
ncbi:unnamed protein product [Rotaria sp. Silwood1]|nr:unnamed protein product [Rotaria sp. Silwood1]CAF3428155.1 unnamed protein product [Rotaria sp. Silwood1]CAF3447329.1 unnamed protein product [Rotaria sp. Silwood1]CAF3480938.1 unnamed protein product [Rotaria sp. Silwood1]CAF4737273.1 unnamed protein product [Rotaria sp. Silwood1]